MGFTYPPIIGDSSLYNPRFYPSIGADGMLTYDFAQTLYLSKNDFRLSYLSGVIPGAATSGSAIVLDETLSLTGLGALSCTSLLINGVEVGSSPFLSGVTAGTALADKALVLDASKNIAGINSLSSTTLAGTISTAAQPNITSIGTLSALSIDGNLVFSGASRTISGLSSITATSIGGTLSTASQGFITSLGSLTGLSISGNLVFSGSSRTITGLNSISATNLNGTISTASQPNITSIGTLSALTLSSSSADFLNLVNTSGTTAASMSFNSGTYYASLGLRAISDVLGETNNFVLRHNSIDSISVGPGGNIGFGGYSPDASYAVRCASLNCDSLYIGGTTYNLSALSSTPGTASASKALILDSSSNIAGISSLATDYLIVNQPGGIICQSVAGGVNMSAALNKSGLIVQGFSNGLNTYSVLSFLTDTSLAYSTTTPSASIGAYRRSSGSYSGADLEFWTKLGGTQTGGLFRMGSFGLNVSTGSLSVGPTNGVMDLNVIKGNASPSFRIGAAESSKNSYTNTYTYSSFSSDNNNLSFNTYGTSGTLALFSNDTIAVGSTTLQPSRFTVIGNGANLSGSWQRVMKLQASTANSVLFEVQVYPEAAGTNSNGVAIGTTTNDPLKFMANNVVGMYLNGSKRLNVDRSAAGPEATIHSGGDVWADGGFHSKVNVDGKAIFRSNWSQSNYPSFGTDATVGAIRIGTCDASYNWVTYAPVRGGSYTNASDRRLKKDIINVPYGLSEVLRMTPRRYTLRNDSSDHVGFIAQELADIIPECVSGVESANDALNNSGEPINPMGVDLSSLTAVLARAIQELNTRIDKLVGNVAT